MIISTPCNVTRGGGGRSRRALGAARCLPSSRSRLAARHTLTNPDDLHLHSRSPYAHTDRHRRRRNVRRVLLINNIILLLYTYIHTHVQLDAPHRVPVQQRCDSRRRHTHRPSTVVVADAVAFSRRCFG